jgi:hypothetical protein
MIVAEWSCEVPEEFMEEFLNWSREKLKPYYESHGCRKYSLFTAVEKKYFSYQEMHSKMRYTEQFEFDDVGVFEKWLLEHDENPDAREVISGYRGRFKVHSCIIRVFEQII